MIAMIVTLFGVHQYDDLHMTPVSTATMLAVAFLNAKNCPHSLSAGPSKLCFDAGTHCVLLHEYTYGNHFVVRTFCNFVSAAALAPWTNTFR